MAPEPEDEIKDEKNPRPLDEDDIALLKTYVTFLLCKTLFSAVNLHENLKFSSMCLSVLSLGLEWASSLFLSSS